MDRCLFRSRSEGEGLRRCSFFGARSERIRSLRISACLLYVSSCDSEGDLLLLILSLNARLDRSRRGLRCLDVLERDRDRYRRLRFCSCFLVRGDGLGERLGDVNERLLCRCLLGEGELELA